MVMHLPCNSHGIEVIPRIKLKDWFVNSMHPCNVVLDVVGGTKISIF